jgi:endo-1,4-beta-xylanase
MEAFITWGWWEGDHWRPNGAMMRKDWTPKPNYHAWRKLIYSDWWTKEQRTTDAAGMVKLRGFLGDYRATVTVDGVTKTIEFTLPKTGHIAEIRF